MGCPACGGAELAFPVPADCRDYLPEAPSGAAICTSCLHVGPRADAPDDYPDFQRVSDAFPRDPEDGARIGVLLFLLDSLVLYREELTALAERLEADGVDPLAALDRLDRDDALDPHLDLERRSRQFQQLFL
jgi:hypothetical protein